MSFLCLPLLLHASLPTLYPQEGTSAPLLSRIMKMMNVSNQLCSTMRKQALRTCQPVAQGNLEVFTLQQGQW